MHASQQISRGRRLRAKAAPLQAWTSASSVESLPSILHPRQKSRHVMLAGQRRKHSLRARQ